jgi:hypothetical protein
MNGRTALLLTTLSALALAQWGPDARLTNDTAWSHTSYSNAWCVAATGDTVHVVWTDYRSGPAGIFYKQSLDGGATWSPDRRLDNSSVGGIYPSMVIAGTMVHLAWTDYRDGNSESYYKRSLDGGATWGPDFRLTADSSPTYTAAVAVSGTSVHVAFGDWRSGNEEVYYKRSTNSGATWGPDSRLTNSAGRSIFHCAAAYGTDVHLVWEDERDGNVEIYYKRSTDNGITWGTDTRLTNAVDSSSLPSVAATGSAIHVVWTDRRDGNDEIYYKRNPPPVPTGDYGVTQIVAPSGTFDPLDTLYPAATWHNYGIIPAPFAAWCVIREPKGGLAYAESLLVSRLAAGQDTTILFPPLILDSTEGIWSVRCSTFCIDDWNPVNDTLSGSFTVTSAPPWPDTWEPAEPLPSGAGKAVQAGGWLVVGPGATDASDYVFAAKGNKTNEFYRYTVATGAWTAAAPIPAGREGKLPGKGCKAAADNSGNVYMVKGNNTQGFWRYSTANDSWRQMSDVPLGSTNKPVKDGSDLAFVDYGGKQYVYLLKGQKDEFWRFKIQGDSWEPLQGVPVNLPAFKTNAGSWIELVETGTDAGPYIYLHKSKYHHLHRYDLSTGAWEPGLLPGMPFLGRSGKTKKSKDGGSAAFWNGHIYALKGGNTCEFWRYTPGTDSWVELDPVPEIGPDGKKKKVKAGGDVVSVGGGAMFTIKGNKTNHCWRMVVAEALADRPGRSGVMSAAMRDASSMMRILPNPLRAGFATLQTSGQVAQWSSGPVTVSIHDAAGRTLRSAVCIVRSELVLDLNGLAPGIYFLRLASGVKREALSVHKLVIQR